MEKIGSVICLSFLVFIVLVGCQNGSSNIVKHSDDNYWVKYDGVHGGNSYSYKKVNIKKDDGKFIVQVWVKEVISDESREEVIQLRTKHGLSIEGFNKLSEEHVLEEIDCKNWRIRILSLIDYDTGGKSLYTENESGWDNIHPYSNGEILLKEVCK